MDPLTRHKLGRFLGFLAWATFFATIVTLLFSDEIGGRALVVMGSAVFIWFFSRWVSPPTPTVLYLRRFGDETVGNRIRDLRKNSIAPYVRLVCLHDVETNPDSADGTALMGFAVPVIGLVALGYLAKPLFESAGLPTWVPLIFAAVTLIVGVWSARRSHRRAVDKAEGSIEDEGTLAELIEKEQEHLGSSRRFVFRRIVKLRANLQMWKKAIPLLASSSDAILIDVSSMGEGLLWEIEALLPRYEDRVVFFGRKQDSWIAKWFSDADDRRRLEKALSGREVIWEERGFWNRWSFRRRLRKALLEAVGRGSQAIAFRRKFLKPTFGR